MKYEYKNPLPDLPSQLIRRALEDMEAVEKLPNYRINTGVWHEPNGEVCEVCVAGATMVQEGIPFDAEIWVHEFDFNTQKKLHAIDCLREGDIVFAFDWLSIEWDGKLKHNFPITRYSESPELFKYDMRDLADYLEENGY